jgi:cytochrome P450
MTVRQTDGPITVADKTIPADATVIMVTGAANRGSKEFPDVDRLDCTRQKSMAIPFAQGSPHVCFGQWLARKALPTLYDAVLDQCEHVEIVAGTAPHFYGVEPARAGPSKAARCV